MAYYDHEYHPTRGGYRGRIGGYRGTIGGFRGFYRGGYRGRRGYDDSYKTREQTDFGDPFGDRERGTPLRPIRNRPGLGYDHDARDAGLGYDRSYPQRPRTSGYGSGYRRSSRVRRYDDRREWLW